MAVVVGHAAIEAWQSWAPHATDNVTSILHLESAGPRIFANGQYLGPVERRARRWWQPLMAVPGREPRGQCRAVLHADPAAAGRLRRAARVAACHTVGAAPGGALPRETFNAKSDYVAHPLPAAGRAAMIAAAEHAGRRRAAVRRLRRRDRAGRADRDRVRAPRPAVLHPVLRRRRDRGLDRPGPDARCTRSSPAWPTRTTSTRR